MNWIHRAARTGPVFPLAVFLGLAVVFVAGGPAMYSRVASRIVIEPYPAPFLDTHAMLAAFECDAAGIDVIARNPCDLWHRPHVYSPLWLVLAPTGLTTGATLPVGFILGLSFIGTLFLLPRPVGSHAALLGAASMVSPAVLTALERGNSDLAVFILIVLAVRLCVAGGARSVVGYAFCALAALLKFYPAMLLILAARASPARCLAIVAAQMAIFCIYGVWELDRLGRVLAALPQTYTIGRSFGVGNLADGLAIIAPQWRLARLGIVGASLLGGVAIFWRLVTDRQLPIRVGELSALELAFLLAGGALLVGCYGVASSPAYRAIYLLPIVPALLRLARAHKPLTCVLWVAVWLPWLWFLPMSGTGLAFGVRDLCVWGAAQVLWMWLICALAALLVVCVATLPAGAAVVERLGMRRFAPWQCKVGGPA